MLDSIKSKWNSLNKKGKMIVVVVGVVAVYAISQIVKYVWPQRISEVVQTGLERHKLEKKRWQLR